MTPTLTEPVTYYLVCTLDLCGHRWEDSHRERICPKCGWIARVYGLKDMNPIDPDELSIPGS